MNKEELREEEELKKDGFLKLNRKLKRSWKICPRCGKKAVSKDLRKCLECNGRLLFPGDDGNLVTKEMDWFFMWHRNSINGVEGWHDASYFGYTRKQV